MTLGSRPRLHLGSVLPRHPALETSRGAHVGRPGLLLGLELMVEGEKLEFWAEASPLPNFGPGDDFARAQAELTSLDEGLIAACLEAPPSTALDQLLSRTRSLSSAAARHAVEWVTLEALSHLWGTGPAEVLLHWLRRHSLTSAWPGLHQVLPSSAVLDLLAPEFTGAALALSRLGVHTWKLKCGRDTDRELEALRALRQTDTSARLRLDPGCAWNLEQALDFVRQSLHVCEGSSLSLELVEDPTPNPEEWAAVAALVPTAADEVLGRAGQLPPAAVTSFWVIKPMVHGIGGALELALEGKRRGQKLLASHAFDGPLALRANLELACAVQTHRHAPGLGAHAALAGWTALDPARAELLRGDRAFPASLSEGVLLDGARLARRLPPCSSRPAGPSASQSPNELPRGDGLSIARAAALFGQRPFLESAESVLSFADLREQILAAPALESPTLVPVVATPEPAAIARLLQALHAGTPALLLHPKAPASSHEALQGRARAHHAELRPGDAVIVPTSGSTAEPRLTVHTRASLLASLSASAARLGAPTSDTRWLLSLPFAHVGGLSILLRCLAAGATVVLEPLPKVPSEAARFLAERRVTHLSLVPTQLRRLLTDPQFVFPASIECVLVGGAPASLRLRQLAQERALPVLYTYGLTEMGSQVATQAPGAWQEEEPSVDVGTALPGVILTTSANGALRVGGPMLLRAYLGEVAPLADGLFSTTDAAQLDEAARLIVHGRLDDVIISGGENVTPASVESVLLEVTGVLEACVVGRPSAEWGQEVVAAIVPGPDSAEGLTAALTDAARTHLPPHARPKAYRLVPSLPLLESGKIDRRRVAAES